MDLQFEGDGRSTALIEDATTAKALVDALRAAGWTCDKATGEWLRPERNSCSVIGFIGEGANIAQMEDEGIVEALAESLRATGWTYDEEFAEWRRPERVTYKPPAEGMWVRLESVGNPDKQQYAPISPMEWRPCRDIDEAVVQCQAFITTWNLGGGNWSLNAGKVYRDSVEIARVSYNGRLWLPNGDPYPAE